jgi:hypothetical protein
MVSVTLIASNEFKVQLMKYALSSQKLTLLTVGHMVLGRALAGSVLKLKRWPLNTAAEAKPR